MRSLNTTMNMEKKCLLSYISPDSREISFTYGIDLCFSGNHEGFTEEEW